MMLDTTSGQSCIMPNIEGVSLIDGVTCLLCHDLKAATGPRQQRGMQVNERIGRETSLLPSRQQAGST
jgi:hypothetical protein